MKVLRLQRLFSLLILIGLLCGEQVFAAEPVGAPLFLTIAKLNVRAIVQGVGITPSGAIGVPTNYTDVGWFRFGPQPGQMGNATMNAHVVTHNLLQPGVFVHLHDLKIGDVVGVQTANAELLFRVTKVAVYDVDKAPLQEIFGYTQKHALNLITCAGTWIQSRKMYSQRLVVFTELLETRIRK